MLIANICCRVATIYGRNMSIFIQKLNPITGINDWIVQQEDYDYHQEVARASFADMLHDTERNKKYEAALKSAIEMMHANGRKANVLDIGTGTGLLSMMAVKHGADSVTACEAFKPMSDCALKVIARNGFKNNIKIIPKRSTDLTVGEDGDLATLCNILVTEVFDTELIGEGALSTFSHAHKTLLEKDCIVVPQSATVYAQIVESPFVQNWNKLKDIYDNEGRLLIKIPSTIKNCAGSAAVHDLQLNQLKQNLFKTMSPPVPVFRFDWSGRTPFIFERSTIHSIKVSQPGIAQAVFMWWDLQMDTEVLSDGFYLSLCASRLGAKKIFYVETNYLSRKILLDFIEFNEITNVEVFENIEALQNKYNAEKINMVIGEPYFLNSILPWDNLLFIYLLKGVRHILTSDAKVFPKIAVIKGIAVRFTDLNKIRLPLGECEGFILKDFDDLIEVMKLYIYFFYCN
jgi:predicted RNA methylase